MTDPITIVLLGEPVPWARAGGGKSVMRFTAPKQRNNAAALRMAAQQAMLTGPGYTLPPLDKPVSLTVLAEFSIPRSWSKKKQQAALVGEIRHGKKPDIDRIANQVMDAIGGVVYRDDALVDALTIRKRFGVQPKVVITVEQM